MLEGELAKELPEEDVRYLWGRVALEGARVHHENALRWFARPTTRARRPAAGVEGARGAAPRRMADGP
jgi:hypothetical protein